MAEFYMPADQILSLYREAGDKKKQISILAELNLCEPRDIARFLYERCERIPASYRSRLDMARRDAPRATVRVGDLAQLLSTLPQDSRLDRDGVEELFRRARDRRCHR